MSRRKEMYLVIDTETCNTVEQPLPYDIGFAIAIEWEILQKKEVMWSQKLSLI